MGQAQYTEGPLHQAGESVSGCWILEAADREAALRLAVEVTCPVFLYQV